MILPSNWISNRTLSPTWNLGGANFRLCGAGFITYSPFTRAKHPTCSGDARATPRRTIPPVHRRLSAKPVLAIVAERGDHRAASQVKNRDERSRCAIRLTPRAPLFVGHCVADAFLPK